MADDLLHVLLALAAFFVPIGFAWFVVSRTARRHEHPPPADDRRRDAGRRPPP